MISLLDLKMIRLIDLKYHIDDGCYYHNNELVNGFIKDDNQIRSFKNGILHRSDGPAIVYCNYHYHNNDFIAWYENGKKHRVDGPAVQFINSIHSWHLENNDIRTGYYQWWYKGKCIDCSSQEEFERIIKLIVYF